MSKQKQNDFNRLFYETLASVAEIGGNMQLANGEKTFIAVELVGGLLAESRDFKTRLAEQFDRLILTMGEKEYIDLAEMYHISLDRMRIILDTIKQHREAFVELDKIREMERTSEGERKLN